MLGFVSSIVVLNGLVILAGNLLDQLRIRDSSHVSELLVTLPLISGLTLVYLGILLHRRKRAAWVVTVSLYMFILGSNLTPIIDYDGQHKPLFVLRNALLPLVVVLALLYFRVVFTVKSNVQNFRFSLTVSLLILSSALAYGVVGYTLLDVHDFSQEITPVQALHHTVDQFDFTTNGQLVPQTKRATYFVDSLNLMTAVAVGYGIFSLFQPIKIRLKSQATNRLLVSEMLHKSSSSSEDFFKLWPQDKSYFFDVHGVYPSAALAYRVQRGVALVVSDPCGQTTKFNNLLTEFSEYCRVNDWQAAFVHVSDVHLSLYKGLGFQLQKIGEEAIVNIEKFEPNKYFRQIGNKFQKAGYTTQLAVAPHSPELLQRLKQISDQWQERPGRQERGFMMGNFSIDYLQQTDVLLAKDGDGVIQAFLNIVPTFQPVQASYDLLRQSADALGNVSDFMLLALIEHSRQRGYKQLNLGLCPLSGLEKTDDSTIIDSTLRFVYANGDRLYSFSGLRRFKQKYQPEWQPRYVAYRGGLRGFSKALYALNKAMSRTS